MNEVFHVSQRIVCVAVKKAGGILKVAITKELLTSVLAVWKRYQAYLEERRKQEAQQLRHSKKSLIEEEIESNRHKSKKLEKSIAGMMAAADN